MHLSRLSCFMRCIHADTRTGILQIEWSVSGSFQAGWPCASSRDAQGHLAVARCGGVHNISLPPITNLALVHLPNGESLPPGYKIVQGWDSATKSWAPCPLSGRGGSSRSQAAHLAETFLCFSRKEGAPILDVGVLLPRGGASADVERATRAGTGSGRPRPWGRAGGGGVPPPQGGAAHSPHLLPYKMGPLAGHALQPSATRSAQAAILSFRRPRQGRRRGAHNRSPPPLQTPSLRSRRLPV